SEAGTYKLIVDGSGETIGGYSFRLLDISTPTLVSTGTAVNGTLSPGLSTTAFRLNGNAGQRLYFDSQTTGSGTWTLYAAGNQNITSTILNADFEVVLPATGIYTLVLFGNNAANPINFAFTVFAPPTPTTAMTLGTTVNGSLTVLGQQDTYTFTGSIGQCLLYDALQ